MKIAIVGCGAMGSVYAGLFAAAGHEVWAIDRWHEHVEAMRAHGLRLEGASGDRTVRVQATTEAKDAGACDLVILATKAMQVAAAAESAKALVDSHTLVLSIQNGLGGPDTAASILGKDRVMGGGVRGLGASSKAPGHEQQKGMGTVGTAEHPRHDTRQDRRMAHTAVADGGRRAGRWQRGRSPCPAPAD